MLRNYFYVFLRRKEVILLSMFCKFISNFFLYKEYFYFLLVRFLFRCLWLDEDFLLILRFVWRLGFRVFEELFLIDYFLFEFCLEFRFLLLEVFLLIFWVFDNVFLLFIFLLRFCRFLRERRDFCVDGRFIGDLVWVIEFVFWFCFFFVDCSLYII